jgi:hypothetical protein
MKITFPALNLKTKLVAIMVVLLALTLGAAVMVSLRTQAAIVSATEVNFKELASAIQISVRELTAVGKTDHDRLQNYLSNLRSKGIEVSIASSENLIINSSNPRLVGAALKPRSKQVVITERLGRSADSGGASAGDRSASWVPTSWLTAIRVRSTP